MTAPTLHEALELAVAGRIRSVAICFEGLADGERTTGSVYDLGDGDIAHLICALERLKLRLLEEGE